MAYLLRDTRTVTGLSDLSRKLAQLEVKTGKKVLRKAVRKAAAPVRNEIKASAPVGREKAHRTYKGRLVAPGFLKRSVRLITTMDRRTAKASAVIGVRAEAFYGVQFLDSGITVTQRDGKTIKPYTIPGRDWFERVFVKNRTRMENDLRSQLKTAIETVSRR